jgi:hypothetical protein
LCFYFNSDNETRKLRITASNTKDDHKNSFKISANIGQFQCLQVRDFIDYFIEVGVYFSVWQKAALSEFIENENFDASKRVNERKSGKMAKRICQKIGENDDEDGFGSTHLGCREERVQK